MENEKRLIDANALLDALEKIVMHLTQEGDHVTAIGVGMAKLEVDIAPTIDAALVGQGQWIPVTERLPEHNKAVLVYCRNLTIQGGYTVHIGSCDSMCGGNFWFLRTQPGVSSFPNREWGVTHWMPLPEPPKEVLADA